jgi:hypothetical protein
MKLRWPAVWVFWVTLLLTSLVQRSDRSVRSEEVSRDVPGELIVSFTEQNEPVMSLSAESITSVYPALNELLDDYRLSDAKPLFYSNSPQQNVFVFEFPVEMPVDEVASLIREMPFTRESRRIS